MTTGFVLDILSARTTIASEFAAPVCMIVMTVSSAGWDFITKRKMCRVSESAMRNVVNRITAEYPQYTINVERYVMPA